MGIFRKIAKAIVDTNDEIERKRKLKREQERREIEDQNEEDYQLFLEKNNFKDSSESKLAFEAGLASAYHSATIMTRKIR